MSKVKAKKHSTFIDMTAMSDVTVLLLTFFMLTANFIPKEPVQVITPDSVSEFKIPDGNVLTILISKEGKVFLNLDLQQDKIAVLKNIGTQYGLSFTNEQVASFVAQPNIGMPINQLRSFLDLRMEEQDKVIKDWGIPTDSTNNQFKTWVTEATKVNKELTICIKSDGETPYPIIKKVMGYLQDMKLNRYSLITKLKPMPAGI